MTGFPFLNHLTTGSGSPSTLHLRVTGSFFTTEMFNGCSTILGSVEVAQVPEAKEEKREKENVSISTNNFYHPRHIFTQKLPTLLLPVL